MTMMMMMLIVCMMLLCMIDCRRQPGEWGAIYGLLDKTQTACEVQALTVGSLLADRYNSLDEETEWDQRLHTGISSHLLIYYLAHHHYYIQIFLLKT